MYARTEQSTIRRPSCNRKISFKRELLILYVHTVITARPRVRSEKKTTFLLRYVHMHQIFGSFQTHKRTGGGRLKLLSELRQTGDATVLKAPTQYCKQFHSLHTTKPVKKLKLYIKYASKLSSRSKIDVIVQKNSRCVQRPPRIFFFFFWLRVDAKSSCGSSSPLTLSSASKQTKNVCIALGKLNKIPLLVVVG